MVEALQKSLLEELQCPVCVYYMCSPICQCENGHSLCEECFTKVKNCPKCRAPKSDTARSYALEAIHAKLNVPCRYSISGCDFVALGKDIKNHQVFCKHAPKYCPFKLYDNCQWKDLTSKLKSHLSKKHSSNFYIKEKQKFMSQNFTKISNYHYIYAVILAFKEFFRLTWDLNETTNMSRWAVYFMGSPEDAKKFSYKLEFIRGRQLYYDTSTSLVFKSVCDAMPQKDGLKFVEHHCFYVHKSLLRNYCEENGDLNYRVTIYSHWHKEDSISEVGSLFRELSTESEI